MVLDAVAALMLWKLFERGTHGLLVLLYFACLLAIAAPAITFFLARPGALRTTAFVAMLLPSVPMIIYSAAAAFTRLRTDRQFSGTLYFSGPALHLAQALIRQDAAAVKERIPAAGDLNQPHGENTSLWQFAVLQTENTDGSIEILRTLIAAGADPRRDTSVDTLTHALAKGSQLTRFLLEAGANPNLLDQKRRPLWWTVMSGADGDTETEPLTLMLDHGADLSLREPSGRGPVGVAAANGHWYAASVLIERGADWKREEVTGGTVPELLEWEILRREEYQIPVPRKLRAALAQMTGKPVSAPVEYARKEGEVSIPELLRTASVERLDEARSAVARLSQRKDWVPRMVAFFADGDPTSRDRVALLLSLKPEALPEDVQERCWAVVKAQVNWYDRSAANASRDPKGWLLRETAVIAQGLVSIPGPARDRHRADFTALRNRIETCRKANDPASPNLPDLTKSGWADAGQV